jgi:hypothetical protein
MHAIRSGLAVLLLATAGALAVVLTTAPPATACSCAMGDQRDYLEWADAVFTGEVTERAADQQQVTYRVDVDRVYEGAVPATTALVSGAQDSMCGMPALKVGRPYIVYATGAGDHLSTSLCSGTRSSTADAIAGLERITGPGTAPAAAPAASPHSGPPSSEPPDGEDAFPVALTVLGGGAVVVIAAALVLAARRKATTS